MRVGVLCEESGTVRDAFIRRGHDAVSCDILPRPGPHLRGDCLSFDWSGFDLLVCFPPCTYLCSMGVWWNHKRPARREDTGRAMRFVQDLWALPAPAMAIENPVGCLSTKWMEPSQVVHPWQFGHECSKPTCLWLRGLPPLVPTNIVGKGEFYTKANGKRAAKWSHRLSGRSPNRARVASRTFQGIAEAMAEQWSPAPQEPHS
jgi:hypothetical protein